MIYTDFQGKKLPLLGFGTMRLPTLSNGEIDEKQVEEMVRLAMANGVNYFDTAHPYHGSQSERVIGRVLRQFPRESFYLADKFPGHQISASYDPQAMFESQLKKCGVEYFDFYLLHNVYEKSIETYLDPQWGILPYFLEQKRLGRIRHLGFSTHGGLETIRRFLDIYGDEMEFCQIQLNYLDWTLQDAKAKVALLKERKIPVWVMEPVRGGKLCQLKAEDEAALKALRPDEKIPAWGFRFLQGIDNVQMILSGMSNLTQMKDNIQTFQSANPLTPEENDCLLSIAEGMKNSIPCTGCRYCTDHCPQGIDIPMMLSIYNEIRIAPNTNATMRIEGLPPQKQPSACLSCGQCARMCPQNIDIPTELKALEKAMAAIPSWAEVCRQREEAARKAAQG